MCSGSLIISSRFSFTQSESGTGHDTTRSREERMRLVREHMHDSGVHPGRDADGASMSDASTTSLGGRGIRSTEEYLARLGIRLEAIVY